jgi:hypothetical protein
MNTLKIAHGSPVRKPSMALLLLLIISSFCHAQDDYKPKLGFVDREALVMSAYPGDSTADAVVLYDFAEVKFHYDDIKGFMMTMKCWVRIKILKESALDRASISLKYIDASTDRKSEFITDIEGYTHNMTDNRIVTSKLDKKSVQTEKLSESHGTLKLNLPHAKKGSVIEYSYTLNSPLLTRIKPATWSFQTSIPIKWSEYRITIPHFLEYKMTMGGYLNLSINKNEKVHVSMGHSKYDGPGLSYRFVLKDAPAFNKEPFITTADDYLSKISFELESISIPGEPIKHFSHTWDDVDNTLLGANWFGPEFRKNIFSKELKEEVFKKTADSTKKMNLAYAYLQANMKWDGTGGLGYDGGIKKAFENKKGSATEINMLLINLLRELDVDCDPVVLSTRAHGRIFEHLPSLEAFNYVIARVKIGANEYLLDASQSFAKPGMLPEHCFNGMARVIPRKGKGYFIPLKPRESKSKLEIIDAELMPDEGTMKGTYAASIGGYDALDWRETYAMEPEQVYLDVFKKRFSDWKIDSMIVSNKVEKLDGVVGIKCAFETEDENAVPGVFYFNPILAGRMTENPLKSPERIFPLDLATGISTSFIGNYKLPDGYFLEEIPKTEIITLPERGGRFLYQVKQTGNMIQVNTSMMVNKLIFVPEEYGALREFFERVVQKHAQPLVIKKKVN